MPEWKDNSSDCRGEAVDQCERSEGRFHVSQSFCTEREETLKDMVAIFNHEGDGGHL